MEVNEVAVTFIVFNDRAHCQDLVLVEVNCAECLGRSYRVAVVLVEERGSAAVTEKE